jgi:hypothetical protein
MKIKKNIELDYIFKIKILNLIELIGKYEVN